MKLRELRKKRGLTMNALAKKSGVSAAAICLLEQKKRNPNYITISKLARALGVTPEKLMK